MSSHIFWPPLAVLAIGIMVIIFIILKYGDKLFRARTVPRERPLEFEMESSENTAYDEDQTIQEEHYEGEHYEDEHIEDYHDKDEKDLMEIMPIREKYEYAV